MLALKSGNEARLAPPADQMIWVGSVLGVMGPREAIQDYAQKNLLKMSGRLRHFADLFNPSRSGISEAVIPPTSAFIGKAQAQLQLRKRFGISLLAINRENQVWREDIRRMPLKAGDMLVFHSIWTDLAQASESRDFVVVTDYPKGAHRPQKLWWALGVFMRGDGARADHPGAGADRADGGRRGDDGHRRAEHGRGLRCRQLEDRVPDGLPDPAGLGDGFHRRGRLDRPAHARAHRARRAGLGAGGSPSACWPRRCSRW